MRMPFMKDPRERRVEGATWGSLLVWVGILMTWKEPRGIGPIVAGSIMLGSALFQKLAGWEAGLVLWAGGIAFLLSGINDRLHGNQHVPALAVVLIIIGGMIFLRAFGKPDRRSRHVRIVKGINNSEDRPSRRKSAGRGEGFSNQSKEDPVRTTVRLALAALAVMMFAVPTAHAETLESVVVFQDGIADNFSGFDTTPLESGADLVAGLVGETDATLNLTWQVVDLNDVLAPAVPEHLIYYWEIQLKEPNHGKSAQYQIYARLFPGEPTPVNTNNPTAGPIMPDNVPPYWPYAAVKGDCGGTTLITCPKLIGYPAVSVDAAANTVTVKVPRNFLKASDGTPLAVDGAVMSQVKIFQGMTVCVPAQQVTNSATCDLASMDDDYTLGTPR